VRSALVALLSTALLVVVAPDAGAETWAAPDPRADVRAFRYDPDHEPCSDVREHRARHDKRHDIRQLAVDNGADTVVLTLSLGHAEKHDRSTTYQLHVRTPRKAYLIYRIAGDHELLFAEEPDYPSPSQIKDCSFVFAFVTIGCDGMRGDLSPKTDQLVITIPRVCLGEPTWVRVAAQVTGYTKPDAQGRSILSSDFWAPRGVERKGFLPPFGPRVHQA
jgi:hypothetical protein